MAQLIRVQIAVLSVLVALSVSATARPCRTFVISSYSFSFPSDSATVATVTEIRSFLPAVKPSGIVSDRTPLGFSVHDFSSLRERTKDILGVVVALLFGAGCGAVTAATMYLLWSMCAMDLRSDCHDEIESPKKIGYVNIPAKETAVSE
ncbi:hypothetical protein E2542_SST21085 [Spatholobus suberectus]|nr:hypothetical protein E2542_SST21085 [Spatholobus suberectus]